MFLTYDFHRKTNCIVRIIKNIDKPFEHSNINLSQNLNLQRRRNNIIRIFENKKYPQVECTHACIIAF